MIVTVEHYFTHIMGQNWLKTVHLNSIYGLAKCLNILLLYSMYLQEPEELANNYMAILFPTSTINESPWAKITGGIVSFNSTDLNCAVLI